MSSMSDPLLAPIPGNDLNTRVTQLEEQIKLSASSGGDQSVGDWKLVRYPPSGWDSGNLTIVGKYAVPNGVTYDPLILPDLDALAAAAGYPDGTNKLPDALGRALVVVGSHVDVALNKTDSVALANRTPKHNSSGGGGGGTFVTGGGSVSVTGDGHGGPSGGQANPGTYSVSGYTTGTVSGGSIGPGGTRPIDMSSYLVIGILLLRVFP